MIPVFVYHIYTVGDATALMKMVLTHIRIGGM
jgi:hypothetical protein